MCKGNYADYVKINMPYKLTLHQRILLMDDNIPTILYNFYKKYLTELLKYGIIYFTIELDNNGGGIEMDENDDPKVRALKEQGMLNPKPEAVEDELFQKYEFFDARDLLQTKYEMVRRVEKDRWTITQASKTFGFSRPSFYNVQNAFDKEGLPGLIPGQRGPKKAHKLSDDVMMFVEQVIAKDETIRAPKIVSLIEKRFGLKVHPRSIERALERREKKREKVHEKQKTNYM